jgi:hypothetical protein
MKHGPPRSTLVLLLASVAASCSGRTAAPPAALPTAPSSSVESPPIPAVATVVAAPQPGDTAVALFGIASEITDAPGMPAEGVRVDVMSCPDTSPGCGTNIQKSTVTSEHGVYRIEGLYQGRNNFLWITKDGYEPVGLPAFPTVCDDCNKILTLNGDTQFDFTLVRR